MQTFHSKNNESVQKKTDNTVSTVLDKSSQSESLQRKADLANGAAQRTEAPRPNNTGMPDNLKAGIESLSGFSMDDVRVHYNSSKPATVQALAYTQGTDIHVAPGQEKHLPHEAWHVAQQMAGRVSPTTNINGMPVNDNAALEHEADVMGEKAVQCKKDEGNIVSNVLQCVHNIIQCNLGGSRGGRGGFGQGRDGAGQGRGGFGRGRGGFGRGRGGAGQGRGGFGRGRGGAGRGRGGAGQGRDGAGQGRGGFGQGRGGVARGRGGFANRGGRNSSEILQNGQKESSRHSLSIIRPNQVASASGQNKSTTCSIKVGISYRTQSSLYDYSAINAINSLFGNTLSVEPVFLPKVYRDEQGQICELTGGDRNFCKRVYSTADFEDIDMFFIPGNIHALDNQDDSALSSHMIGNPLPSAADIQERITHKWEPVEGASEDDEVRYKSVNDEYQDRFGYEDKLISYARLHGIPVMAVCGGSWQLYHNFNGKTKLLNVVDKKKHSKGMKDNFAHNVRLVNDKKTMLSGIICCPSKEVRSSSISDDPRSMFKVNSTHWASVKPVEEEYGITEKEELNRLRKLKNLNEVDLERKKKLEGMDELEKMIDISSYEISEDGQIVGSPESFETKYGVPMIGVQWHPETFLPGMKGAKFLKKEENQSAEGNILISNSEKIFRFMLGAAIARKRKRDVVRNVEQKNVDLKKIESIIGESRFLESIINESRFVMCNFRITDMGSSGNNCLLNSLYAQTFKPEDSFPQEVRQNVIDAEGEIPDMADEGTTETSFLNPLTLIPVLRNQHEFNHNVWIYDATVCSWMYWANGEDHPSFGVAHPNVSDATIRSEIQNDVFLYYVGQNHYQRMSIKSDDVTVAP